MFEDKLEYTGKVYLYSSGMPEDLITLSKEKLAERGVNESDIVVLLDPVGVPEGSIMATIWPHYLSVARVKRVREGSIYAPQLFNIQF
ncbi:hypothetical protein [Nitrososphaera sp.]|uniref:hypothetical protein n=1 Tax=Nitrososphaera sp. TaxID=1971748 RepID=UPI002ED99825